MELINITRNEDGTVAVSGRELHEFLEVGRDYTSWIKARIEKYDFEEGIDYILLTKTGEQGSHGGHNKVDYILTLDTAKELAMVENNEKGRQARKYFIEVEKKYRERPKHLTQWEMMKVMFNKTDEHEERLTNLENNTRISSAQERKLQELRNAKVTKCLGGKKSFAYDEFSAVAFANFGKDFKTYFEIPRYGELPKIKLKEAELFIEEWIPCIEVRLKIKALNEQGRLEI